MYGFSETASPDGFQDCFSPLWESRRTALPVLVLLLAFFCLSLSCSERRPWTRLNTVECNIGVRLKSQKWGLSKKQAIMFHSALVCLAASRALGLLPTIPQCDVICCFWWVWSSFYKITQNISEYPLHDYNLMFLSAFLHPGREASVHTGPYAAEGQLSVYSPAEKQHGIWLHYHRGWWTRWVPTGQKCHTRWACCTGWKNGYR